MKKFLLPALLATAIVGTAGAKDFKDGIFTFRTTSASTVEVAKADSKTADGTKYTEYTVPATVTADGVTYTVTAVGREAFRWAYATKITLPETIDSLKYGAFNGSELAQINIPESVTYIGDYSFSSTKITEFVCPKNLKEIGYSAFFTARNLKSITFNDGLEKIGASAFYKVPITKAELPATVKELGKSAFMSCSELTEVKLSPAINSIGSGTFYQCAKLTSIEIPDGVTVIGDEAMLQCTMLTELTIPASVTKIGTGIVAKSGVAKINLAPGNTAYTMIDGVLYTANKRLLTAVPPMADIAQVNVDKDCIGISGGAFWGSKVTKVTLPEGFLAIDAYAFCQSELADINFPASLTYIGDQGFADTKITSLELPVNMPYVLDGAFAGMTKLTQLVIPSGVKLIYNHAFHNNVNLKSVTCLGSVPPVIDDVYETYDSPFYGISTTTPLYVPKGTEDAYKEAGWGEYFKITASEQGVLAMTSATPADGTVLGKYADMAADIVFGSDITIVNNKPAVFLRKDSELSGAIIEADDCWNATAGSNKQTLRVWASDYDGYTMTFSPEAETEYYLIIPAGTVKDASGNLNERIVLRWVGPAKPKPIEVVSTSPANESTFNAGWKDMVFEVTFATDVNVAVAKPAASLRSGDATTGTVIEPDDCWIATKQSDGKTVRVWASDYDGYTQSFKGVAGTEYFFTLPAGVVKDADGNVNDEIVIKIVCTNSDSVSDINAVDAVEVARYDINGRPVSKGYNGLVIIRMSDGSVRKAVMK